MPSYSMNHIIHSDETEVPGMKILYADKSEPGCVTYINDVVYDVRSGVPLHLQMLLQYISGGSGNFRYNGPLLS